MENIGKLANVFQCNNIFTNECEQSRILKIHEKLARFKYINPKIRDLEKSQTSMKKYSHTHEKYVCVNVCVCGKL